MSPENLENKNNFDSWSLTLVAQRKSVNQDYFLQSLDVIVKAVTERVFRWELKWKFVSPWKNSVFNSFHCTEMKWNSFLFRSFDLLSLFWWNNSILKCFLSDDFISIKWNHPKNKISMKFYFCQNNLKEGTTANEFHFSLFHVNSFQRFTGHRIENISFRPKRQKQPPEVFCKKDVKILPNSLKNTNAGVFLFNKVAIL